MHEIKIKSEEESLLNIITIDRDGCKGCGLCIEVCPKKILRFDTSTLNVLGYHPVFADEGCIACGFCAIICPDMVFSIYKDVREGEQVGKAVDERQ